MIDLAFSNINLPVIKILRLLRTLRPLRFISHNNSMKTIVIALLESVGHILNVVIVVVVVWLMFAILGVNLFGGKMFYCSVDKYQHSNQIDCERAHGVWKNYNSNFDNTINAMMTLFIVSSFEGWPTIMQNCVDTNAEGEGPVLNASPFAAYFFIAFIFIGSFFFLNFFIGVLFLNYKAAQKEEKQHISDQETHWQDMLKMIQNSDPDFEFIRVPKEPLRLKVHSIVTSNAFDIAIMSCIVLNMVQMALYIEGAPKTYVEALEGVNLFFTAVFLLEAILKIAAFGFRYFKNGWNRFDFFVVVSSIFDIVMAELTTSGLKFLRIGPQLARILRVLRVSRILRLIGKYKGLQALIQTIVFSLPPLSSVFSLLMLVFFIYSILGVFLFKSITHGDVIDPIYMNFRNFSNAMILLLSLIHI